MHMKEKDLFFMFNSMKSEEEQLYRTLYGAIAGDALGIPAEFMPRSYLKKNVACIAGSIAGASYTYTTPGITVQTPNEWILKLGNLKLINKIIKKYASFIFDKA